MTLTAAGMFPGIRNSVVLAMTVLVIALWGSSWDVEAGNLRKVQPNLKPLDLSRSPSVEELMAAGQLGGQLYPTADIVVEDPKFPRHAESARSGQPQPVSARHRQINLSFGTAIQEWNSHHYVEAVKLFKMHVADFPDSPWASEALLHLGCDAFYHGRSAEAEGYFLSIIERNRNNGHEGAKIMTSKARLRLAVLKAARNNIDEAVHLFSLLARESTDWRDRTYATQWLRRLSAVRNSGKEQLACGTQALSRLLELSGLDNKRDGLDKLQPDSVKGFSLADIAGFAAKRGVGLTALRLKPEELGEFELPALVHIAGRSSGDSGHYWVLEKMEGDLLTLFDPQGERYYNQTIAEFAREWSGAVLVRETGEDPVPGVHLAAMELKEIAGGCCGVPKSESDLGDEGSDDHKFDFSLWLGKAWAPFAKWGEEHRDPEIKKCEEGGGQWHAYGFFGDAPGSGCYPRQRAVAGVRGAPGWWVNPVNMNLFVKDIPLWYRPALGPAVEISLSYNSQSAIAQHEPFGAKWQFNYASYLVVDTSGEVTIFMANGRRDVYSPNLTGGYLTPYRVYNTLVKLAENHFELRFPDGRIDVYTIPLGTSSLQPFLTESSDAYGNKLAFTYDSQIRLTTITAADGSTTNLAYNADGLVSRVTDPFGRHADFEYALDRTLTRITDMGGYAYSFTYDAATINLTSLGNSQGTWQFYIEPADGINNSADSYPPPGGIMWENYRITVTDPLGSKEEFYYNGYAGSGWHIQPRDYVSYYSGYDGSSTPKTGIRYGTTSGQRAEISTIQTPEEYYSFNYDANGNLLDNWDGAQYTYNSKGMITSITDVRKTVTTRTYGANGIDVLTETNGLGTISYAYNASHDITSITDQLNHVTTYTYNGLGQPTSITDPLGTITSLEYYPNPGSRLKRISTAGEQTAAFTYDGFGRVQNFTNREGVTREYQYNALDDVIRITYPDGTFVATSYSSVVPHLVSTVTDRAGMITTYGYDMLNRLVSVARPDRSSITFTRDGNGNVTALTDGNGNITRITYDLDNRPILETYPDGTTLSRIFLSAGVVMAVAQANGDGVSFYYDSAYNLIDVGGSVSYGYSYDPYNRRVTMSDSRGTTHYTYDAASRLKTIEGPEGSEPLSLTYDNAGHRTGISYGGRSLIYAYDQQGRIAAVTEGTRSHSFSYTAASLLPDSITRPSGSSTTFLRDSVKRPLQVENKKSNTSLINRFDYSYAVGRSEPDTESVTGGAVVPATPSLVQVYGYDSLNRLASGTAPARTFTRDQNGNLTGGYAVDGSPFSAAYDGLNRLIALEYTDTGGVLRRWEHVYDGDGQIASTTESADGTPVRQANFLRLGPLLLRETDGNGDVARDYTWGAADGYGMLLGLTQGGNDYEYFFDGRGRVAALMDSAQTVAAAYSYDPLDNPSTSGTVQQPFRSSFLEFDERSGLYQSGAGFYLPNPGYLLSRQVMVQPKGTPAGPYFQPRRLLGMRLLAPSSSP